MDGGNKLNPILGNLEEIDRLEASQCTTAGHHSTIDNANFALLNNFFIHGRRYHVFLQSNLMVWEMENSKKKKAQLPICDIISVKLQKVPAAPVAKDNKAKQPKSFTVDFAQRKTKQEHCNIWRHKSLTFTNADTRIVQLWATALEDAVKRQTYRPQKLLLFVNPFGGKQNSMEIFQKYCKPLFELGKIDVNVIVSQRADQIRDFILSQSLKYYDGIACIGGDGTFSEVFNGLLQKTMNDTGLNSQSTEYIPKPSIPIGVIPGGSTDTVAYCLHGTTDIQTCVIHIILGLCGGLDLCSVSNGDNLLRFYASVMSYGFLGDVALDSEKYRWMGPSRYNYSGFKKFLSNRGYESEIKYLEEESPADFSSFTLNDGPRCLENCQRCIDAVDRNRSNDTIRDESIRKSQIKSSINDPSSSLENDKNAAKEHESATTSGTETNVAGDTEEKWKTIRGKFFMINGANLSCACARSPNGFSPFCHIGDGFVDLILIKHTSFLNNLRLLLRMSGKNKIIADLPFVDIHRTKRFQFKSLDQSINASFGSLSNSTQPLPILTEATSNWNCDGEVLHEADVIVRSHCQVINVYRRGLKHRSQYENPRKKCCFCF